jgi:hypothetical protein
MLWSADPLKSLCREWLQTTTRGILWLISLGKRMCFIAKKR